MVNLVVLKSMNGLIDSKAFGSNEFHFFGIGFLSSNSLSADIIGNEFL